MQDLWQSGNPYEFFMGRWSKPIAELFVDWLSPKPWLRWLDVGCGTGALSEAIINKHNPKIVYAIDQSEEFVLSAQKRLGDKAECKVGNALSLPFGDASVDIVVSGLVLNFITTPEKALDEMKRITIKGGTVAAYIWDYAGNMEFLSYFWDTAIELDPDASILHEGRRFPDSNGKALATIFESVGFSNIKTIPLEIEITFSNFENYWQPFLGGQGPAPTYISKLKPPKRKLLQAALLQKLPIQNNGSIILSARSWAVKGIA